ncbi:hypothetical protein [Marinobacterium rhizophilum]|uniref:Uncharacterized protein n=1 Tax=Marinobacterium rhizophilum TaxID=420402 RepID=A0ABY5HJW4_9GAMM|nr:hypothetical protein [Marinobacterium rhizophilum]UTW11552.1 hypothetical protein KDW95_20225 [Marinobacterium rhizophilum]
MQNSQSTSVDKLRCSRAYQLAQSLFTLTYLPLRLITRMTPALFGKRTSDETLGNDSASAT